MPDTRTPTALRILYVEDNALVREVTAELLVQEGRQISPAPTPKRPSRNLAKTASMSSSPT
jgi:CheY-like chemotaxis protein